MEESVAYMPKVEDIFEAVNGPAVLNLDEAHTSSVPGKSPHAGYYNFLLTRISPSLSTKDVHPLPSQLLLLWQIYIDNIDPFIKILHVPTMSKVIRDIGGGYDGVDFNMRGVILAVSVAAIMTLDEDEVCVPAAQRSLLTDVLTKD